MDELARLSLDAHVTPVLGERAAVLVGGVQGRVEHGLNSRLQAADAELTVVLAPLDLQPLDSDLKHVMAAQGEVAAPEPVQDETGIYGETGHVHGIVTLGYPREPA